MATNYNAKCLDSDGNCRALAMLFRTDCIFCPYTDPLRKNEYFHCALSEVCCGNTCCTEHEGYDLPWYYVVGLVVIAVFISCVLVYCVKCRKATAENVLPEHMPKPKKKKKMLFVNTDKDYQPITTAVFSHTFPTIMIQSPEIKEEKGGNMKSGK